MRFPLAAVFELRGALAILASMQFVSSLGIGVMLPVIPLYAIALGASPRELGLLTSAFSIANVAGQLGIGLLLDRIDSRLPIRGGIATYAVGNALIASAGSTLQLVGYRFLAGLGAGMNIVSDRLYLSRTADPSRLAFVNGVIASAAASGQLLGPGIGGVLAQVADLRAPFVVVALTSAVACAASFTLPRAPDAPAASAAPGAPSGVFGRSTVVLLVANGLLLASFGGFITTFAPYATERFAWSTGEIGIVFSLFAAGGVALAPPLARMADQRGRRRVARWVTLPVFLFSLALALALPRPLIYLTAFVAGGAISTFTACWFALLTEAAPAARRGRTFGVIQALSALGTLVGANGAAAIWDVAGLPAAIMLPGTTAVLAGLTLNLLPRPAAPPVAAEAAAAPTASSPGI